MSTEFSSNQGYIAFRRETTEGVIAGVPNLFSVLYNESLNTSVNTNIDTAVFGNKAARMDILPGIRSHAGEIEILAEPNTSYALWDMLLTRGSVSGSDPYTWPYTASFVKPGSYTVDFSMGADVVRYLGVGASEITHVASNNVWHWKAKLSALKSFLGAEITSVSTATVTLKTPTHNAAPSTGLIIGDTMAIVNGTTGVRQDLTVLSLTATTVTFSTTPTGVTSGDMLVLRATTPSLALLVPFLVSRTEFRFADTAANALTGTRADVQEGSEFVVSHPFENDSGTGGYGLFDPNRLVRSKAADVTLKVKRYYENALEARTYNALSSQACVIRMFSGSAHEFRLTLNKLVMTKGGDKAMIKVDEALFLEEEFTPAYHSSDGQMFDVKIINGKSS